MSAVLYAELAGWWSVLSPPSEYVDEAAFFWQTLQAVGLPPNPTLLELGSGGGNNAVHLKAHFAAVVLSDLAPGMVAVSQALNPDCEHVVGDMRTLRLERTFDVVFIHDAVCYMTTLDDLRRALATAAIHCEPGGVALFVPDFVRETFEPDTEHGGSDDDERALRYLAWVYDPDPADTTYTVDYVFVVRDGDQPVQIMHEQHIEGLFSRADWLRMLGEAGFTAEIVTDHYERELCVARRKT